MDGKFYCGVYRGFVIDNNDPENLLRLRIHLPTLGIEGIFAAACVTMENPVVPAVGSGVWILFEEGNPSNPVWIGTFRMPGQ
jgi:hypothetical protein